MPRHDGGFMKNSVLSYPLVKPKNPKLSVCIVSFNQKDYIKKCIQSVIDQEINFQLEILIADDCSTDGTRSLIDEFVSNHPDKIFSDHRKKNVGAFLNYKMVHASANGEYVMHLDGDDYCLPEKLQKQVDFLDQNIGCNLVAHRMCIGDGESHEAYTKSNPEIFGIEYLLGNHPCFLNSSIMYRRSIAGTLFSETASFIDFYVYVHFALKGPIGFVNEVLGYYRAGIGISSKRNLMPYIQQAIDLAADSLGETAEIKRCRSKSYLSYAVAALMSDDGKEFQSNLLSARTADKGWSLPYAFLCASLYPSLLKKSIRIFKARKANHAKSK